MADESNPDPGRSFLLEQTDRPFDNNLLSRRPRTPPAIPGTRRAMRTPTVMLKTLGRARSPPQSRLQRQRVFRHRPNTFEAADALGADCGASNLADYEIEPNRYDLPAWMVDDIHTMGSINAQLMWKRQKEEEKR